MGNKIQQEEVSPESEQPENRGIPIVRERKIGNGTHQEASPESEQPENRGISIVRKMNIGSQHQEASPESTQPENQGKTIVPLKYLRRRFLFFSQWGQHFFFVDKSTGMLLACGRNSHGELSLGDLDDRYLPEKVPFFEKMKILDVATGGRNSSFGHSLFLTKNGTFASGDNRHGQLSIGENSYYKSVASRVVLQERIEMTAVFCDENASSYFLTKTGEVFSSGLNFWGQLGQGDSKNRNKAERIQNLSKVVHIITGAGWAMFQCRDNSIYACGYNLGQFGLGHEKDQQSPVEITYFKEKKIKISWIVSSRLTSFYMTKQRHTYVSGENNYGQFGKGTVRIFRFCQRV